MRPRTDIDTFLDLDICAGVVERAEPFPEARKPSLKLWIDFGDELGTKTSSAQLTRRYSPGDLVGTSVLGVINPEDAGDVILVRPDGGDDVRGWRLA